VIKIWNGSTSISGSRSRNLSLFYFSTTLELAEVCALLVLCSYFCKCLNVCVFFWLATGQFNVSVSCVILLCTCHCNTWFELSLLAFRVCCFLCCSTDMSDELVTVLRGITPLSSEVEENIRSKYCNKMFRSSHTCFMFEVCRALCSDDMAHFFIPACF